MGNGIMKYFRAPIKFFHRVMLIFRIYGLLSNPFQFSLSFSCQFEHIRFTFIQMNVMLERLLIITVLLGTLHIVNLWVCPFKSSFMNLVVSHEFKVLMKQDSQRKERRKVSKMKNILFIVLSKVWFTYTVYKASHVL